MWLLISPAHKYPAALFPSPAEILHRHRHRALLLVGPSLRFATPFSSPQLSRPSSRASANQSPDHSLPGFARHQCPRSPTYLLQSGFLGQLCQFLELRDEPRRHRPARYWRSAVNVSLAGASTTLPRTIIGLGIPRRPYVHRGRAPPALTSKQVCLKYCNLLTYRLG